MIDLNPIIRTLYRHITTPAIGDLKAYIRLCRVFLTVLRLAAKLNRAKDRAALKRNMLSDAGWRGRVLRELGGETALLRWDRRFEKSRQRQQVPETVTPQDKHEPPRQTTFRGFGGQSVHPGTFYDRIKVDMEGQFCLAPITGSRARKPRCKIIPYENPFGLKVKYTDIDPVPVTPNELRCGIETMRPDHEAAMQALRETAERASARADKLMSKTERLHRDSAPASAGVALTMHRIRDG